MGKARGPEMLVLLVVAGLAAPVVLLAVVTGRGTRRQVGRALRLTAAKIVAEIDQWK